MTNSVQAEVTHPDTSRRWSMGVGTALQKTWWLGLGILATVGEQTARVADALVQKGRSVEPAVVNPVKRAAAGVSNMARKPGRISQAAEGLGNAAITALTPSPAGPTKEEFEKLSEEVRNLRGKLGERANKPGL